MEIVNLALLVQNIREMSVQKSYLLIGIEGRCASGKTTFAAHLRQELSCNVIHMDDFFLRPEQRTPERMREPGGNVDYRRFLNEVLIPLRKRQTFTFKPYDCHTQILSDGISVEPLAVNVVEGAYSCHPVLRDYYDYRIFFSIDSDEQYQRIIMRNGLTEATKFKEKWIPLEEQYFSFHKVLECCDAIYTQKHLGGDKC